MGYATFNITVAVEPAGAATTNPTVGLHTYTVEGSGIIRLRVDFSCAATSPAYTFLRWDLEDEHGRGPVSTEQSFTQGFIGESDVTYNYRFIAVFASGVSVRAVAVPANEGTATVTPSTVTPPSYATFEATPNAGCRFIGWYDGTGQGASLVSRLSRYVAYPTSDMTLYAWFRRPTGKLVYDSASGKLVNYGRYLVVDL